MAWNHFKRPELKVESKSPHPAKPRYGLTSDILSFRRCPRQYGFFSARGFVPAHRVQLFYGTIIHEVLDRAHHHFKGLYDPATKGTFPTEADIEHYFDEVEKALRAKGVRSINRKLRDQALVLLKTFNRVEGPKLYQRVIDTEYRVQADRETHIVEGVVDLLVDSGSGSSSPDKVEIWDYKGSKRPDPDSEDMLTYTYQMRVYAALYKVRNGCYPGSAVLYFLNELTESSSTTPDAAIVRVNFNDKEVSQALGEFDKDAVSITSCKQTNSWAPPPPNKLPDIEETCTICDLRWSCPSFQKLHSTKAKFS